MSAVGMTALALIFPTLVRRRRPAPGVDPWDPGELEDWACGPAPGSGARGSARFLLGVWAPHGQWRCGCFTLADFAAWDSRHRDVFLEWARRPWWP